MQHPYEALKKQNAALLAGCYTEAGVRAAVDRVCDRALKGLAEYTALENKSLVRVVVTAGLLTQDRANAILAGTAPAA